MSRIGKKPVLIPAGVTASVDGENLVTIESSKGKLTQQVSKLIKVEIKDGQIILTPVNETREANSMHGLYRTLLNNMVEGVTNGFSKTLTINGVGFKVNQKGENLELNLGFSHLVTVKPIEGVKLSCSGLDIKVEGISKELVGQMAANIRAIKPVEPYHAYGIRYSDEVVMRKEGKKAGK